MTLRSAILILAFFFCLFAGLTVAWLQLDRQPPTWDDAWYLSNSLLLFDALSDGGVLGFVRQFLDSLHTKAPLIVAFPAPLYVVFGRRWQAAFLVNIAAMLLLFIVVFLIGVRLKGKRAGLIAVFVTATMPLLYGLSRWYLVEYTLTAAVATSIAVLVLVGDLQRKWAAALFGFLAGVGLLLKVTYPFFVLPLFLVVLWRTKNRGRAILFAAVPCLLVAAPWYSLHWRAVMEHGLTSGYGEVAEIYGTGSIFSWRAISAYLKEFAVTGVSLYYIVLALLAGCAAAIRRKVEDLRAFLPLAAWFLPLLLFLFGGNKDVRFVAPILPAFALALGICLDLTIGKRTWIALPLLLLPLVQMSSTSFGWPYRGPRIGYARPFAKDSWQHSQILDVISSNTAFRHGEKKVLLIGTDRAMFNANNLELAAVAARLPLSFVSTAYEKDKDTAFRMLDSADFFAYKEGGEPESPFFNVHAQELIQYTKDSPYFEELKYGKSLPDGGRVHIWRKSSRVGRLISGPPQEITTLGARFGNVLELSGFQAERSDDVLTVRYGWRSLELASREYWCFTHVVGENGKVLGYLDHRILNGDPPLTAWRLGDTAVEERRFVIPAGMDPSKVTLRLGLYYPPDGQRLVVSLPAKTSAAIVDEGTAVVISLR